MQAAGAIARLGNAWMFLSSFPACFSIQYLFCSGLGYVELSFLELQNIISLAA